MNALISICRNRVTIIVITGILLLSCEISMPPQAIDFNDIHTWVVSNIAYKADVYDEWQSPHETIKLGTGDCEDSAILLSAMCGEIGISTSLLIIWMTDMYHMVVEYDGWWYSGTGPGFMQIKEESIVSVFTLNEALVLAVLR